MEKELTESEKRDQERKATVYGAFTLCYAAEILLKEVIADKYGSVENNLQREPKMAYMAMTRGIRTALSGYKRFNELIENCYINQTSAENAIKYIDQIHRDGNEAVRDYFYRRNAIDSDEDQEKYDNMVNNFRLWHPGEVISQEKINKFRFK